MSCTCVSGFTGKGDVHCDEISTFLFQLNIKTYISTLKSKIRNTIPISIISFGNFSGEPEPIGCSSDFECTTSQACRDRSCINPCIVDKPCSPSAICTVRNNRASCSCPPGFEGDPFNQCNKSKRKKYFRKLILGITKCLSFKVFITKLPFKFSIVQKGECQHDNDCRDSTACIENQCLDPCPLTEPCGQNAKCTTSSHRPVCRCPSNWAGNPHEECYQRRFLKYNNSMKEISRKFKHIFHQIRLKFQK